MAATEKKQDSVHKSLELSDGRRITIFSPKSRWHEGYDTYFRKSMGLKIRHNEGSNGYFTQFGMFGIYKYLPAHKRIMSPEDFFIAHKTHWKDPNQSPFGELECRTNRYVVYKKNPLEPIGKSVFWSEDVFGCNPTGACLGIYHVPATFNVPDLKHPSDKSKGLQDARGMVQFDIKDLTFDFESGEVNVKSDFDEQKDFYIVISPEDMYCGKSYFLLELKSRGFSQEHVTGYHGSAVFNVSWRNPVMFVDEDWHHEYEVAIIDYPAVVPLYCTMEEVKRNYTVVKLLEMAKQLEDLASEKLKSLGNKIPIDVFNHLVKPARDKANKLRQLADKITE
jgi:hypothetical protein